MRQKSVKIVSPDFEVLDDGTNISANLLKRKVQNNEWLPFVYTYRTLCQVPKAEFRAILQEMTANS